MSGILWKKSMEKLKVDKSKFSYKDIVNVIHFIDNNRKSVSISIIQQIFKDIEVYKKYDAIVMWTGDGGLIEFEPEFIKELVKIFEIEE